MNKYSFGISFYILVSVFFVVCDVKSKKIRRIYLLFFIVAMFILALQNLNFNNSFIYGVLGGLVGFFTFEFTRLFEKQKLGFADVLYATAQGLFLGIEGFYIAAILACLLALIAFLIQIMINSKEKSLPFVPFLVLGSFMYILFAH